MSVRAFFGVCMLGRLTTVFALLCVCLHSGVEAQYFVITSILPYLMEAEMLHAKTICLDP